MVLVIIGKSQDVRTDQSFVNVTVGDPDVADVNPPTDHSLSILGKKIGTTRVSVYADDKKMVGIFEDPGNKFVHNNLKLLDDSWHERKAMAR